MPDAAVFTEFGRMTLSVLEGGVRICVMPAIRLP